MKKEMKKEVTNGLEDVKTGDQVIMKLFSGCYSGVKTVEKTDTSSIYFTTGKGLSKFDRATGKMVEPAPKSEKYANFIIPYDEEIVKQHEKKPKKRLKKAVVKTEVL